MQKLTNDTLLSTPEASAFLRRHIDHGPTEATLRSWRHRSRGMVRVIGPAWTTLHDGENAPKYYRVGELLKWARAVKKIGVG